MTSSSLPARSHGIPIDVKAAVALFGAALVVGAIDFAFQRMGVSSVESEALSSPANFIFGVALTAVFMVLVIKRHNWARVVLTILTVLGLVLTVPVVAKELSVDTVGAVMSVVQVLLQIAGLVFLFRGPANAWFARR